MPSGLCTTTYSDGFNPTASAAVRVARKDIVAIAVYVITGTFPFVAFTIGRPC